jgi:hypothetical protein
MKTLVRYLTVAVAVGAIAVSARANATLELYDWFTNTLITVPDQALGLDLNPAVDVVTWVGSIGAWSVNVSTGLASGTQAAPIIHINTVDMTTSVNSLWGYEQLSVWFTVNNLGPTAAGVGVVDQIGGTTVGQVGVSDWYDPNNGVPAFAVLINPPGWGPLYGPGAFSATTYGGINVALPGPYSLTGLIDIYHYGPGITSIDLEKRVPDSGMTAVLLGLGLLGVGLASRRFKA